MIDAMSTRRHEVTSVAAELGLDSLKARQYAAQASRTATTSFRSNLRFEQERTAFHLVVEAIDRASYLGTRRSTMSRARLDGL